MRWMAVLLALPGLTVLQFTGDRSVCSPVGVPISRASDDVFFIGSATSDTVRTGPGSTRYGLGEGHSSYGRSRNVYGQVVRMEKVVGTSATRLPPGTQHVVLVPWDYGPDCLTVIWGGSARWVAPGTRGVYEAKLRERKHWADIPTLDVFQPDYTPYPSAPRIGMQWRNVSPEKLSIEEALDLFERLPNDSALSLTPISAAEPLEEWARINPGLVSRDPARVILRMVYAEVDDARLPSIRYPLPGTYRFVLTVPQVDSLILFARTEDRAWEPLHDRYAPGTPEDNEYHGAMIAYKVLAAFAKSPSDLPAGSSLEVASAAVAIGLGPLVDNSDSVVWRGAVSFDRIIRRYPFWSRAIKPLADSINAAMPRDWYYIPGFWIRYPNGTVRYRHTLERNGVVLLSVIGERLSSEMLTSLAERN